ncbi:MAG: hypothetical protein JWL71_955 [Acidobacteria bacterium]|nr:hypothetical protein [Acidobacteriota bacterium]
MAPVPNVNAPSLLLLHKNDACVSSNSERALRSLATDMPSSKATVVTLDGGSDASPGSGHAAACHPLSYHGFNGIDSKVSSAMIKWATAIAEQK